MKRSLPRLLLVQLLALTQWAMGATEIKSPDGEMVMVESDPVNTAGEYQLQRVALRRGDAVLWEYACSARKLRFQWSADSRHCLFAQVNGGRDMSLFVVSIDHDFSPRLQELDLAAVHEKVIERIPEFYNRPGGSAPVSFVDWDTIRWVDPTKCEMVFIDKSTGLDSEARLQVVLGEDRSKLTVLEVTDKLAARMKVAAGGKEMAEVNPKRGMGYVPDEQTAIKVAVAVWSARWGEEEIAREKPYKATLKGEVWEVTGHVPAGTPGGVALAEISKEDGTILRVSHGQ